MFIVMINQPFASTAELIQLLSTAFYPELSESVILMNLGQRVVGLSLFRLLVRCLDSNSLFVQLQSIIRVTYSI